MRITETTSIPFAHLTEEYRERGKSVVYVSGTGSVTVKFVMKMEILMMLQMVH